MKIQKAYVGIDMSINSTGVCILKDNKINFYVYPRSITKVMKELLESSEISCNVKEKIKPDDYKTSITIRERFNSSDARVIISEIVNFLKFNLYGYNVKVAIEGIAFMSRGNSIAQVSGYHYILRHEISTLCGYENIFVFQPTTVKKTAGKGNFKKSDMINAFMKETFTPLVKSSIHKILNADSAPFKSPKTGEFKKPIDDLVDSYWVLQTLLKYKP